MKLTYRLPTMADVDLLLEHINAASKEETYIGLQKTQITRKEELTYLQTLIKNIEARKNIMLLAFEGDVFVGTADIKTGIGAEKHVGTFGIIIKKEYRNQGIGTALMAKVIQESKKYLKELEIITLGVFADNERALHVYQKFGFKKYGELPNGLIRKGQYSNHIYLYLNLKSQF